MILTRSYDKLFVRDFVDKTVLVGNPARPISFEFAFKWFGLADAGEWRPGSFRYEAF
jgi:hypothetical protein